MFYIPPSHVFSPDDAAKLESLGLLTPIDEKGFRKLHKRRVDKGCCTIDDFEFPLDARPDTNPEAFISYPDQVISKATIVFCAFIEEKAAELWYQWENWPVIDWAHKMEQTFMEYILESVQYPKCIWYLDDDHVWTETMNGWGICADFQEAIMDPAVRWQRDSYLCNEIIRERVTNVFDDLAGVRSASHHSAAGKPLSLRPYVWVEDEEISLTEWMERQGIGLEDL